MATSVIMPALELAQETGKVIRWLKAPGDAVTKGEPLLEIETDKVTTEIEAPASGILMSVSAGEGDVIPVGQAIAQIGAPGEAGTAAVASPAAAIKASPLARKIAEQHGVDLVQVKTSTGRIEKADVLAYVEARTAAVAPAHAGHQNTAGQVNGVANRVAVRLGAASPKARRLAAERGLDIHTMRGSGPQGAVLAADILSAPATPVLPATAARPSDGQGVGAVWRIMAERMTASWTTAPHFYLFREVTVGRLAAWRQQAEKQTGGRITYTDVLVKLVAAALARHPAVNASWRDGAITRHAEINIGLAVAVEDGLIVPVIHRADTLGLAAIAARREDVVSRAQGGKLRPADIQGGTFTISNLGMFGVDAFNAIVNPPQAAILAVGRIADRVVALDGQPAVQPTMMLTLSCDHRALDGARAARFLGDLADLIEEPLALLV
jgi:pyruvate dehydrogenase E2 component (dihydrolipoamide acetyltransferase)